MRPHSEVRQALLGAAACLATPTRGPTLAELAAHAQVGREHARHMVGNLRRYGALRIARTRQVAYRNRPVAEYECSPLAVGGTAANDAEAGFVDLGQLVRVFHAA